MTVTTAQHGEQAALRGVPSLVWRAGQDRRLSLIRQWSPLDGAKALVDGCGIGMYVRALQQAGAEVWGLDIEHEHALEAVDNAPGSGICQAAGEHLPYPDGTFDLVLSHEVIEHVEDDRAYAAEMVRVLRPPDLQPLSGKIPTPYTLHPSPSTGGRAIIFCPNRLYPFETHGHYWRGQYHFGNTPLRSTGCPIRCAIGWRRMCARTQRPVWRRCSRVCPCVSCTIAPFTPVTTISSIAGLHWVNGCAAAPMPWSKRRCAGSVCRICWWLNAFDGKIIGRYHDNKRNTAKVEVSR